MKLSLTIVRNHILAAKAIHFGMFLWSVLRFKKPKKVYNHCEVRFGDMTSGALAEGIVERKWQDYVDSRNRMTWIDYDLKLTKTQYKKAMKYLKDSEGTPYEFEIFFWHLIKIITGKWKGGRSSKELYCYEHGIKFLNATGKYDIDPFMNPIEFKEWADKNLKNE